MGLFLKRISSVSPALMVNYTIASPRNEMGVNARNTIKNILGHA